MSSGILVEIAKYPQGITSARLAKTLKLPRSQMHLIWKTLRQLERKGQIIRTARTAFRLGPDRENHAGIFKRKMSGAGDAVIEPEGFTVRLNRQDARKLVDGDRIEVRVYGSAGKRIRKGTVVRIVERRPDPILGYFHQYKGGGEIVPLNPRIAPPIRVSQKVDREKLDGKIVAAQINPPGKSPGLSARIEKVLGSRNEAGVETAILIFNHGLRDEFPEEVLREAELITGKIAAADIGTRRDLRDDLVITVDPESARDFDDALSVARTKTGYRLGVHIADVSHYVHPGSAIDREAYQRGTSVYFPERAVHMLPERLSTDICSLRPDQDKLTVTVWIDIDPEGTIVSGEVEPSIIRSKARMTYAEFYRASRGAVDQHVMPEIVLLCKTLTHICTLLLQQHIRRGVLDLDMPEAHFRFNPQNQIIGIHRKLRSIAEQSIEEFMIAANVIVAGTLDSRGIQYFRRIHEPPDPTTVDDLKTALKRLGIHPPDNPLDPDQVRSMLSSIDSIPIRSVASYQILRAMKRAEYSIRDAGHFGLALSQYTQFTSPIRRYPDLEVHRAVKSALGSNGAGPAWTDSELETRAKHLSEKERDAQEAEWNAVKLRKIRFMSQKIGEEYTGTITHVEPFGAFVELDDPFVEGLIPVRLLEGFYRFIESENKLSRADGAMVLKPGMTVKIKVECADIDRGILDFSLVV